MQQMLLPRTSCTVDCVTISAPVDTRIIHPDIYTLDAPALFSLSGIFLKIQLITDQIIDLRLINTGAMPDPAGT